MTGFEVNFSQSLPAQLQADVNIAYVFGKDLSDDKPLPEIPPLDMRIALSGNYFKHKFKPELSFRYVLEQDRINESFGENSTPEFVLIDIAMEYKINKAFRVKAGVKNLLDEAYYEHLSRAINGKPDQPLYAPGRNIFLTLNYSIF
jgi:iron complex outermembrane recepter protein